MSTEQDLQREVYKIRAFLSVASLAAGKIAADVVEREIKIGALERAVEVTGNLLKNNMSQIMDKATWSAIISSIFSIARSHTKNTTLLETERTNYKLIGAIATQKALSYSISHEETIFAEISAALLKITIPVSVNCITIIDKMLYLANNSDEMNIGGKCWYFAQVWRLIMLASSVSPTVCSFVDWQGKMIKAATEHGLTMLKFVDWLMGPTYSQEEFLSSTEQQWLIKPLLCLVYAYFDAPAPPMMRKEILSLI